MDMQQAAFAVGAKAKAKAKSKGTTRVRGRRRGKKSEVKAGVRAHRKGKKESSGESDSSDESEVSGMDENVVSDDSMGNSDISERDVKHKMEESGMVRRNAVRWLKNRNCFRGRFSKQRWNAWETIKDRDIDWSKWVSSSSGSSDEELSSSEGHVRDSKKSDDDLLELERSLGGCRTAARAGRELLRERAPKRGVQDGEGTQACFSMICL
jgi:hypothetical protein